MWFDTKVVSATMENLLANKKDIIYFHYFPFTMTFTAFFHFQLHYMPNTRPTNDIAIKLEIRSKFVVLWFKKCSAEHNKMLHTSRQCYCRDVCKILLWSVDQTLNHSITKFHWISNSIEV